MIIKDGEKITINEIAKLSNVAKSTVSRYLNGGHVSEVTKTKIKAVIDKYNYEPNIFAQSLKAKNSNIIGIIAPCLDSAVTSKIVMSIDEEFRKKNYQTIIINTSHSPKREVEYIGSMERLKVDAIILIATQFTNDHILAFGKCSIPILLIGQKFEGIPSIINKDYETGYKIGKYVASKNHSRIMYLGVSSTDIAVGVERRQGVIDGLISNGEKYIKEYEVGFNRENALETVLQNYVRDMPSAIICATDKIAIGALQALHKIGISVPNMVSVAGFGGYYSEIIPSSSLATIRFDNKKTGEIAVDTVIKLINKETVPMVQESDYVFIKGDTVKNKL